MDANDPIPEMYYLDVASPGAERPIKKEQDFQNAITKPVFVSLYVPIESEKEWLGILQEVNNETIVVQVKIKSKNERYRDTERQNSKSTSRSYDLT